MTSVKTLKLPVGYKDRCTVHGLPAYEIHQHGTSMLYMQPPHNLYIVLTFMYFIIQRSTGRKITQNSTEVDVETKESTRKTEEKLDGRYEEGYERKKLK